MRFDYFDMGTDGAPAWHRIAEAAGELLLASGSLDGAIARAERTAARHKDSEGRAFYESVVACLKGM
jgi:hypothetical protein